MNQGEKEIVRLMGEWQKKITQITVDYSQAIGKLKDALDELKLYKKSWYIVYKTLIISVISLVLLIISLVVISKFTNWCKTSISLQPLNISAETCK